MNRDIIGQQRKRVIEMEKVTSVNGFLASLPKIPMRKVWNVVMDGKVIQGVSATDNRKSTAEAYIASKYPGKEFTLVFLEKRIGRTPS